MTKKLTANDFASHKDYMAYRREQEELTLKEAYRATIKFNNSQNSFGGLIGSWDLTLYDEDGNVTFGLASTRASVFEHLAKTNIPESRREYI